MKRDGFLRCYIEAWAFWLGLNFVGSIAFWLVDMIFDRPGNPTPFSHLGGLLDPFILVAQGILIVPLFAAILVGNRRSTGRSE